MSYSNADPRLYNVSTNNKAINDKEASILTALDINLSSLLLCSLLDILLYLSEELPS